MPTNGPSPPSSPPSPSEDKIREADAELTDEHLDTVAGGALQEATQMDFLALQEATQMEFRKK